MRLTFEVTGEKIITRDLLRHAERAINPEPAFLEIMHEMEDDVGTQFDTEGASMGGSVWAPLQASTLLNKARLGQQPDILQATRRLVNSLVVGALGEQVFKADPAGFEYGTRVPYAIFHQKGTAKMPARRIFDFTEPQRRKYTKTLQEYLVGVKGL